MTDVPPPPAMPPSVPPHGAAPAPRSPRRWALLAAAVLGWVFPLLFIWTWPASDRERTTHPGDQVVRVANWVSVAGGVLVLAYLALCVVLGLAIGAFGAVSAVTHWLAG